MDDRRRLDHAGAKVGNDHDASAATSRCGITDDAGAHTAKAILPGIQGSEFAAQGGHE